jgi:hypothetical protein
LASRFALKPVSLVLWKIDRFKRLSAAVLSSDDALQAFCVAFAFGFADLLDGCDERFPPSVAVEHGGHPFVQAAHGRLTLAGRVVSCECRRLGVARLAIILLPACIRAEARVRACCLEGLAAERACPCLMAEGFAQGPFVTRAASAPIAISHRTAGSLEVP